MKDPAQTEWSFFIGYTCHCVDFDMVSLYLLACLKGG